MQKTFNDVLTRLKAGQTVHMKVKRGADTVDVSYVLGTRESDVPVITNRTATISAEQMKRREIWMFAGKKKA